jgi:hypothetical protein
MQEDEVESDDSASEDCPKNTNPDIAFDAMTGKVAVDFDKGEWLIIMLFISVLTYTGVLVF